MPFQFGDTVRNNWLDSIETTIGTPPVLRILTGAPPATVATAQTGTVLVSMNLPSDWMAAASGGSKGLLGTWSGTAGASGTAGYFRILNTAGSTAYIQGTCGSMTMIPTTAATAATDAVLTFASTSGVVVGQRVSGTGIPADTYVIDTTGTTVTLNQASSAGVSSGTTITFQYDMTLDNTSIASGQTTTVTAFTLNSNGA